MTFQFTVHFFYCVNKQKYNKFNPVCILVSPHFNINMLRLSNNMFLWCKNTLMKRAQRKYQLQNDFIIWKKKDRSVWSDKSSPDVHRSISSRSQRSPACGNTRAREMTWEWTDGVKSWAREDNGRLVIISSDDPRRVGVEGKGFRWDGGKRVNWRQVGWVKPASAHSLHLLPLFIFLFVKLTPKQKHKVRVVQIEKTIISTFWSNKVPFKLADFI